MSVDPHRLLVLRAVHQAGGVLAAATRLHLTPSGVSQHLARLEQETGLALVDRSRPGGGRALALTAAGVELAEHGDVLAGVLADVERTVAVMRGSVSGPVGIGSFPTALRRLVVPAVVALATSHPALRPRVVDASEPDVLQQLSAGALDVAVLDRHDAADRDLRGLVERPLLRDPYRVVVPESWPPAGEEPALLGGAWVVGPPGSAARLALDRMMAAHGVAAPAGDHVCLEYPAALALVAAGLGAALVPELALQQYGRTGVRVLTGPLDPGSRLLTVAHRSGRSDPSPAVDAVVAELRRQVGQ